MNFKWMKKYVDIYFMINYIKLNFDPKSQIETL